MGDNSDDDIDGDGVNNDDDRFPYDPFESRDQDRDGIGDNSDDDIDGDGLSNLREFAIGTDPMTSIPMTMARSITRIYSSRPQRAV